jgi:hypothetical protein
MANRMATITLRFNSNNEFQEVVEIRRQFSSPVSQRDIETVSDSILYPFFTGGDFTILRGSTKIIVEVDVKDGDNSRSYTKVIRQRGGKLDWSVD